MLSIQRKTSNNVLARRCPRHVCTARESRIVRFIYHCRSRHNLFPSRSGALDWWRASESAGSPSSEACLTRLPKWGWLHRSRCCGGMKAWGAEWWWLEAWQSWAHCFEPTALTEKQINFKLVPTWCVRTKNRHPKIHIFYYCLYSFWGFFLINCKHSTNHR